MSQSVRVDNTLWTNGRARCPASSNRKPRGDHVLQPATWRRVLRDDVEDWLHFALPMFYGIAVQLLPASSSNTHAAVRS